MGNQALAFCKGAPEAVGERCDPSSLPADFAEVAAGHAQRGCDEEIAAAVKLLIHSLIRCGNAQLKCEGRCSRTILYRHWL